MPPFSLRVAARPPCLELSMTALTGRTWYRTQRERLDLQQQGIILHLQLICSQRSGARHHSGQDSWQPPRPPDDPTVPDIELGAMPGTDDSAASKHSVGQFAPPVGASVSHSVVAAVDIGQQDLAAIHHNLGHVSWRQQARLAHRYSACHLPLQPSSGRWPERKIAGSKSPPRLLRACATTSPLQNVNSSPLFVK